MKKKLLMAAVGAALVAGPMVAAHAGATAYGHFHMSFDRFDNDNNQEHGMLANNSSRFGFKGSEDLGGGLKTIYQVESGIFDATEGTGGFSATLRNTYVGFADGWGTVKIGRHDTPYKEIGRKNDSFNEQVGDARNVIGDMGTYDKRVSNMIRYDSPNFGGGWMISAQHTSNNGSDAASTTPFLARKDNSLGINWTSGPIYLAAAWNEVGNSTTNDTSGKRLAGSYSMNDWTLGLFWESLSDISGTSGKDRDTLGLFASLKMGNNKLKFHWYDADKYDNSTTADGGTLWAIGVDHSFSKTVQIYANYASVDNDTNGTFNTASGNGGHDSGVLGAVAGKSPTAYTLGTIIKF